jgi:hypothetical protein
MTFDLPKSLLADDLPPYTRVVATDTRTGEVVGEGQLALPGKTVATTGHMWQAATVGPAVLLTTRQAPYIAIDSSLEGWTLRTASPAGGTGESGTTPADDTKPCLLLQFPQGEPVGPNSSRIAMEYAGLEDSNQLLAGVAVRHIEGITTAGYAVELRASVSTDGTPVTIISRPFSKESPAYVSVSIQGILDIAEEYVVPTVRIVREGDATNCKAETWSALQEVVVRAILLDKYGDPKMTGNVGDSMLAGDLITDILNRYAPAIDLEGADIYAGTVGIKQFAFAEPVGARVLFDSLLELETSLNWSVWEKGARGYKFAAAQWMDGRSGTTAAPRYLFDGTDGLTMDGADVDVVDRISVTYRNERGDRRVVRVGLDASQARNYRAIELLDGQHRDAEPLDLSDEVGTKEAAQAVGEAVLAQHNLPLLAGSVNVTGRVRDLVTDRWVQPWEIRAGETAQVRDLADGQVFRVMGTSFSDASLSATVQLGSAPPKNLEQLLARRRRKRARRK